MSTPAKQPFEPVAIDTGKLPPGATRVLDPKTPTPMKQMAARGISPGLKPFEALAIVVLLSQCDVEAVAATAKGTLERLPEPLVAGAAVKELDPGVLDIVAPMYATDAKVMERLLALPQIRLEVIAKVAELASEPVSELVATNEERLLRHPPIIEALYMNKSTRMSTADRILELAVRNKIELTGIPAFKEAAQAILNELIAEKQPERAFEDEVFYKAEAIATEIDKDGNVDDTHILDEESGEEKVTDKALPLYAEIANMSVSQKIRRAMLGSKSDRMILIRDANKLVAEAAVKSPLIQEGEIAMVSMSRTVSDGVLRIIALDREWTRSNQIRYNLVANPRTPFAFVAKLLPLLRDHDLKAVSKNKNVPGNVQNLARQQVQ
ncbi:MAG: hypothetical protein ABI551_24030, partial [Polyangiaceae bacterium]